jgi:DNA-binding response OmpR family regulator
VRILVLEDDPAVRHTVLRVLRRDGDTFIEAATCAQVHAVEPCDLGIFDVELPDGNGIELAKALLDSGVIRAVVFYTGSVVEEATSIGPVITKGDDMAELKLAVSFARERLARRR